MINNRHISTISTDLGVSEKQVRAVAELLAGGATIPFIARYRKEATGSLDEVDIAAIRDALEKLKGLDARREVVLKSLEQNGHLTDDLRVKVMAADSLPVLEDIYLPYKPRRRTKGMMAKEKGLWPLAEAIFEQKGIDLEAAAGASVNPDNGVESIEDALAGARDIMAEMINEHEAARVRLRKLFAKRGLISSRVASGMETAGAKYKDYFDWDEPAVSAPSHRILAMRRGEREDVLNLTMAPPAEEALAVLEEICVAGNGEDSGQVRMAARESYKRLLSRSMETELRLMLKERADAKAIRVFAKNLRQLLLAPPLGSKHVMGIDPGYKTGCKLVCLDRQGKLLCHDTVFPHTSKQKAIQAADGVEKLCERYGTEAIAIGNGTAGRETEAFIQAIPFKHRPIIVMVNESGASVYSASDAARDEFPDHDITVRGAVSIGRRLMDPLSELVKIDPKSIGIGQYQHDVDQVSLKQTLDDTVMSCVNAVGVDVNRASARLLSYVSGLGPVLAGNIVAFRDENGPFLSREGLVRVPRLGPKAFEQCAGFLRIPESTNPLDGSAVHPESYPIVDAIAKDLECQVSDLIHKPDIRKSVDVSRYVSDTVGLPTLTDIMDELAKPGRDPRHTFEAFRFAKGVDKIGDLKPGMTVPGIVTNITAFGAFVDIGVHQDGLVHVSKLSDRYVKDPADVVAVHQKVRVTIEEVDVDRKRIALSMIAGDRVAGVVAGPAETPPKKGGKKGRNKPGRARKKSADTAFNNPFQDALGKL